jgi:hypothetical protein
MRSYPAATEIHERKARKGRKGEGDSEAPSVRQLPPGEMSEGDETEAVLAEFAATAAEIAPAEEAATAAEAAPPVEATPPLDPAPAAEATPAPPVEEVPARTDFQQPPGAAPGLSPTPPARAAPVASADELSAIRAAWNAPESERPAPTRQIVLQMLEGGPGLVVRNMSEPVLRVSVDLGGWIALEPAARHSFAVTKGSHRILVADASGVELARISCLVAETALCSAEIWPRAEK